MKTKILISAIALTFGSAVMAADLPQSTDASATDGASAKPELQMGSPDVQNQGETGGPASAKPDLQLGSDDVQNQGASGGPASAQPKMQLGQEADSETTAATGNFSELDKNNDGYISKEEAQGRVKDQWATADANADGKIDQSEFSALETTEPATSTGTTMGHEPAGEPSPGVSESGRAMDKMNESDK